MGVVRLPVICGPTGAGKSAIAMAIAGAAGASVVSADSRQLYRGFDIGTAKPTLDERARIPHYGVDVAKPCERYSAARWVTEATGWLEDIARRGGTPLVVGGTGFYLRTLFAPLFEQPPLDPARRASLEDELQTFSTAELRRWCRTLDPPRARFGRTQLLRAIEVAVLTGQRISDLHALTTLAPRLEARYLVVDPGAVLRDRIAHRVDEMVELGWEDEVRHLVGEVPPEAPAWNATGYAMIRQVVTGTLDLSIARERIVIATRQYAKRQRTWFRHQLPAANVMHLDPTAVDALDRALSWLRTEESE